jgi:hypothetical protein
LCNGARAFHIGCAPQKIRPLVFTRIAGGDNMLFGFKAAGEGGQAIVPRVPNRM